MGWMNALYETYDNLNKHRENDDFIFANLRKPCQSTQNCHVEVTVDRDANFVSASLIAKGNAETIIPVTEASASRSSGSAPHPLFDKLKYIAGDYEKYVGEANEPYYSDYMDGLQNWASSDFSNEKIKILHKYLAKRTLIRDLVKQGIFSTNEKTGKLTEKWGKAQEALATGNQSESMVRFRITGVDHVTALWEDEDVQDRFSEYYTHSKEERKFCYIKGKDLPECVSHPSKIRNTGDKAKLVSSNDTINFTYRGRFDNADQAFTMSFEASQKCHNALKFLIKKQGFRVGERVYVLWGVNDEDVPDIACSTKEMGFVNDEPPETMDTIAKRFNQAILGYREQLDNRSKLILLGLDAATTGRLAVTFCREYMGEQGNELIDNIKKWHQTCPWETFYWNKDGQKRYYVGMPSLYLIAETTFGTEQGNGIKCNKKLLANTVERLIPCVCDGKSVPRDIVHVAVHKALHPQNYDSKALWRQVMAVACVLYGKYLFEHYGEEITMNVNENSKDLGYNCGRLLAVADEIERWALREKNQKDKKIRTTNAVRYFTRFAQKPEETWGMIEGKIAICREQLGSKGKRLYDLLGEISENINVDELKNATNLGGSFCLGFDSQRLAFSKEVQKRADAKKMGIDEKEGINVEEE